MDIETYREFCLSLAGATEDFPFGEDILVFRVGGKIFSLCWLGKIPLAVNLKCDPQWAQELREAYPQVRLGYHMNKKHWNTVEIQSLPPALVRQMVEHSYGQVVAKLPKSRRPH